MRLYPRHDVGAIDDPEFGHFELTDDGGFDFPGPLADRMHGTATGGQLLWEDAIERQRRLIEEEAARRADPRTLLDAVEKLVEQSRAGAAQTAPAPAKPAAAAKAPAAKGAAPKTPAGK